MNYLTNCHPGIMLLHAANDASVDLARATTSNQCSNAIAYWSIVDYMVTVSEWRALGSGRS